MLASFVIPGNKFRFNDYGIIEITKEGLESSAKDARRAYSRNEARIRPLNKSQLCPNKSYFPARRHRSK